MDDQNQNSNQTPVVNNVSEEMAHITQEMYKKNFELAEKNKTLSLLRKIDDIILSSVTDVQQVGQHVVDVIADDIGFKALALYLIDKKDPKLNRIAVSQTSLMKSLMTELQHVIYPDSIALSQKNNPLIISYNQKTKQVIQDVEQIFSHLISEDEVKKLADKKEIISSLIFPLIVREEAIGVLIINLAESENDLSLFQKDLMDRLVGVIGIGIDNALLYQSIQDANERLKMLDKLKDEFVSVASHELRTPMTAIKSYLWMALAGKGGELTEKQRYYVQRGYNSVDRLIRLVNDMLNVSRIDSGRITLELQAVSLDKLTEEVVEEVLPRAQELGVHVSLVPFVSLPPVLADPDKIKEILFNLIGNSLKFTPQDGNITVSFLQKDNMIQTIVQDTGTGMEPDDIPKLFQKFGMIAGSYVANRPIQGTGLGLYICRSIIELHGGKIWAASEGKGKGSQFIFTLPIFTEDDFNKQALSSGDSQDHRAELIHSDL